MSLQTMFFKLTGFTEHVTINYVFQTTVLTEHVTINYVFEITGLTRHVRKQCFRVLRVLLNTSL
jgi:hypothetical protein